MSVVVRGIRHGVVLAAVLAAFLLPSVDASLSAGLLAAVVTLVVIAVVVRVVRGVEVPPHRLARAALSRLVPTAAQSDPDARGHARPRAPGRLLTAV
jgi:uncharacterized membrane protein